MGWKCCMAAPAVLDDVEVAQPRELPVVEPAVEEEVKLDLGDCMRKLKACYTFHVNDTRSEFAAHVQAVAEAMAKLPIGEWLSIDGGPDGSSHSMPAITRHGLPPPPTQNENTSPYSHSAHSIPRSSGNGEVTKYDIEHARAWFLHTKNRDGWDARWDDEAERQFKSFMLESVHVRLMAVWAKVKPQELDVSHVEDAALQRQVQVAEDGKALGRLAQQLHVMLSKAEGTFAPAFGRYITGGTTAAISVAAALMHQFVREKLLEWLPQLQHLDAESAESIGLCDDLQARLIEVCAEHSSVLKVWTTTHYAEPLFSHALKQSGQAIHEAARRVLSMGEWHGSPVFLEVLDIMRLCDVALEQHKQMSEPLHISLARHQERLDHELLDIVGAVCGKFGAGIIKGLPSVTAMQPRPNELRRFKESAFIEAQERAKQQAQKELERQVKDAAARRGVQAMPEHISPSPLRDSETVTAASRRNSSFSDDLSTSQPVPRSVCGVEQLSMENLSVRLNSLFAMHQYLNFLKRRHVRQQQDVEADAASSDGGSSFMYNSEDSRVDSHIAAIAVSLGAGLEALEQSEQIAMNVLAHYVLFISLKPILEDKLYQNDAAKANADAVHLIQALVGELDAVKGCLQHPESHRLAGRCLLHCTAAALERVLLDGGALRFYRLQDVPLLRRDVRAVQDVLVSSRLYLSAEKVQEVFARVHEILEGMLQPTADLVVLHQRLVDGETIPGCKFVSRGDILYILTHRADRDASKYLKTTVSMPKVQGHSKMTKFKNLVKRGLPRR